MQQLTLSGERAAKANASLHVKVNKACGTYTLEVQCCARRPYGTSWLSPEGLTAVQRAGVHPPARASAAALLSLSSQPLIIGEDLPNVLHVVCLDVFDAENAPRVVESRLTAMHEMQLWHVENTVKRGVDFFTGATTAASKSDGPIQQGQTLLCVHLGAEAVVHVKAACSNWRLPTPYLKPALSEDSDMSRRQLRAEGATMRVTSSDALHMTLDLTGLPPELRENAGRVSAAP